MYEGIQINGDKHSDLKFYQKQLFFKNAFFLNPFIAIVFAQY